MLEKLPCLEPENGVPGKKMFLVFSKQPRSAYLLHVQLKLENETGTD